MSFYLQDWVASTKDLRRHALALLYHAETETYDRTVCTGPIRDGSIMPMNYHELGLVNRNASKVRERIMAMAAAVGIERAEMAQAIAKAA